MKKTFFFTTVLSVHAVFSVFADSFSDILQDLAIQTACIGQYSATQTGGGWYDDPHDYYTPQMMAERFKNMSGSMTRTTTFYGVCFDYAQFAYEDIEKYQSAYNKAGMYESQFWIAGVHENTNTITLSYPANRNTANTIQNGVYVKESNRSQNVRTHKQANGTRTTHHAWLWVMRADGVWFWIDPTWTDNLGYVVWGYVANDEEIQLRPDEKYCLHYPDYLKNLPTAPKMGKRKAASNSSVASNYSSSRNWSFDIREDNPGGGEFERTISIGMALQFRSIKNLFNGGENDDISISITNFSVSYEDGNIKKYPLFFQIDTYNDDDRHSILFDSAIGRQIGEPLALYAGGGLGWTSDKFFGFENTSFAWKVNGGARITMSKFGAVRLDFAYASEHGSMFGIFYGFSF